VRLRTRSRYPGDDGKVLDDPRFVVNHDAHHVYGRGFGSDPEECVLLCRESFRNCHWFAHDYDWQLGALLLKEDFPYWNGKPSFWGPPLPV
jgi:hypothetical protein